MKPQWTQSGKHILLFNIFLIPVIAFPDKNRAWIPIPPAGQDSRTKNSFLTLPCSHNRPFFVHLNWHFNSSFWGLQACPGTQLYRGCQLITLPVLNRQVAKGEGWGRDREKRKRLFSLCLGHTCSRRLREHGALLTSLHTNGSELGSISGEEQMALRAKGRAGTPRWLTAHERAGEASCVLDLMNVLENFPMSLVQQTPKHMSPGNFFTCFYFKPLCIFRTMESICSCFIYT